MTKFEDTKLTNEELEQVAGGNAGECADLYAVCIQKSLSWEGGYI